MEPELIGHLLSSRYEVQRRLQSGFFGTTWMARDRNMNHTVCVKVYLLCMFVNKAIGDSLSGVLGQVCDISTHTHTHTHKLQTFTCDSDTQCKELSILKTLCDGHFNHENLCTVLDVCVDRAPVTTTTGNKSTPSQDNNPCECVLKIMLLFIVCLFVVVGDLVSHMRYVVFEYCSGSDLFNFLVTGPLEKIKR